MRAPCLARARLLSGLSKVMMRHMLPLVFNWREQGAGEGAVLGKGAAALWSLTGASTSAAPRAPSPTVSPRRKRPPWLLAAR